MNSGADIRRECPVCGSKEHHPFLQKQSLQLVQCKSCAMVFANPVRPEMTGEFYNHSGTPFYLSPEKLAADYASVRFARELRLFQRFCTRGKVLDVGCSTGAFLFQLKSRGAYQVTGTDISQPALEHARSRGVEIIGDSLLDYDFGATRFDAITFWAVMEHLLEPQIFLDKAIRLLNAGGHCFVLVPNLHSLAVRVLGKKYRYILPQHVNYFTAATLQKLASSSGLEIVARGSMHFNPAVISQDLRGRGEFVSDEQRAALLKQTTALKTNPLLKPAAWAYNFTEKVLASFNLADNLFIVLRKQ